MGGQIISIPKTSAVDGTTISLNNDGELQVINRGETASIHDSASEATIDLTANNVEILNVGQDIELVAAANYTLFTSDAAITNTYKAGEKLTIAGNDIKINSMTKDAADTATTAYIYADDFSTLLGTATYSGNTATFATPVRLSANTAYYLVHDAGGASYNIRRKVGGASGSNAYYTFNNGTLDGSDEGTGHYGAEQINMTVLGTTFTLPSTAAENRSYTVINPNNLAFSILQNASQSITDNSSTTTTGTGGKITCTATFLRLVCIDEDTTFVIEKTTDTVTFT